MSNLRKLSEALRATQAGAPHRMDFDFRPIGREIAQMQRWLNGRGAERPSKALTSAALHAFYRDPVLESPRQARFVCFGCTDAVLPEDGRLIEDGDRFPRLLLGVDAYRDKPRAFRLCYRGLLHAYFGYDIEQARHAGEGNWRQLQAYLQDRVINTVTPGISLDWVRVLQDNEDLLTDRAPRTYGRQLLAGEDAAFEDMRSKLDISKSSWLVWRLVLGQIDAAAETSDAVFLSHLPHLIELLAQHSLVVHRGLAKLLERYRRCSAPAVHAGLRDFAITQWGNPWLVTNSGHWSLVGDDVRKMVSDWLKLELIQHFFGLLATDGTNDKRRLKFWERYHASIDDMYFALGNTAQRRQDPDFRDVRKKMSSRLLPLHSAGSPDNNAFIMRIGGYFVVEFGLLGNACYIFKADQVPFRLTGEIAGDGSGLKSKAHAVPDTPLRHHDRTAETWEQRFERVLYRLMGVRPDAPNLIMSAGPRLVRPADVRPIVAPTLGHAGAPAMSGSKAPLPGASRPTTAPSAVSSTMDVLAFCRSRGLSVQDYRSANGNLWILVNDADGPVARQLRAWGFTHKPGKGWWRK